jgi:hypothetical protein
MQKIELEKLKSKKGMLSLSLPFRGTEGLC